MLAVSGPLTLDVQLVIKAEAEVVNVEAEVNGSVSIDPICERHGSRTWGERIGRFVRRSG